jgi:hypothetical protein
MTRFLMCSIVALGVHALSGMTAHGMKRSYSVDGSLDLDNMSVCSTRSSEKSFVSRVCASYAQSPLGNELQPLKSIKFQRGDKHVSLHTLLINALKQAVKDWPLSELASKKILTAWPAIEKKTKSADQMISYTVTLQAQSYLAKTPDELKELKDLPSAQKKDPLFVFLHSLNALPNPKGEGALGDTIFALLKSSEPRGLNSIEAFFKANEGELLNDARASLRRLLGTLQVSASVAPLSREISFSSTPRSSQGAASETPVEPSAPVVDLSSLVEEGSLQKFVTVSSAQVVLGDTQAAASEKPLKKWRLKPWIMPITVSALSSLVQADSLHTLVAGSSEQVALGETQAAASETPLKQWQFKNSWLRPITVSAVSVLATIIALRFFKVQPNYGESTVSRS